MENIKSKINIDKKAEAIEFKNLIRNIFSFKTLELLFATGFAFFIIILGVWALPLMPAHVQKIFALCILCAACYTMYMELDRLGIMEDQKK